MTARYETRVHARNRNVDYSTPVTVLGETMPEAMKRAVAIGWAGRPEDAQVTVTRVTELLPCSCTAAPTDR